MRMKIGFLLLGLGIGMGLGAVAPRAVAQDVTICHFTVAGHSLASLAGWAQFAASNPQYTGLVSLDATDRKGNQVLLFLAPGQGQ